MIDKQKISTSWRGRLGSAALSNLSAIIAALLIVIPTTMWWFSDFAREFIEGNSYRIESIDRYAIASNTYNRLIGAERTVTGPTRIAVVLANSAPCSNQSVQARAEGAALDMGTLLGASPPGLLATIRYMRRLSTSYVNFEVSSGHILFIAMQGGDLPATICFNERRDTVHIEYSRGDTTDVSPKERILFIETDDPASDISTRELKERSSAYFAVESLVGVCILVFFVGLLVLITRNAHHDRDFEKEANDKLDRLKTDVCEVKDKQGLFDQMRAHLELMSSNLENVTRDSMWMKEIVQRDARGRNSRGSQQRKVTLQELKREGAADGERRFEAGAADVRQRFSRATAGVGKPGVRASADPRVEIRQMKLTK